MRRLVLFFALLAPGFVISQISFEAITDAQSVLQNSTFQITFQLKNAEGSRFSAPDFSPFRIVSGPSRSMQTTIINGAMSSSVGFVFVLTCSQVGSFTIPSARINVNGKNLLTRPTTIKVVKAIATINEGADVFIKAIIEKQEVYFGEQFILSYKLFTRVNVGKIEFASKQNLDAFQEEAVNMLNNPTQREIYEGREYTTKVLSRSALYPIKSGMITIDPVVFRIIKGDSDPFGFGMPSLFRSQVENISSNELKIQVKELPQPIPENFSGAVGEMFVQKNPLNKSYTLNDVIHLGIQLQGDANFNIIKPDFVKLDSSFEISDSKAGDIIKVMDEPRITKTRRYDFLIVPKSPGDFVINPMFVFFNPVQNRYVLIQDSLKINITGTKTALSSQDKKDIADINRNVTLKYHSPGLFKDYRTWILICLPIGLLIINFYQRNADYFKSKNSKNKLDQTSLNNDISIENLEKHLLHKFFLMYSMISDDGTLVVVKQFLHQQKANDALAEKYLDLFQQLETIKFSGSASPEQLRLLKDKIQIL